MACSVELSCPRHGDYQVEAPTITLLDEEGEDGIRALTRCPFGCQVERLLTVNQFEALVDVGAVPIADEVEADLVIWQSRKRARLWQFAPALVGLLLAFSNSVVGVGIGLALVTLSSVLVWRTEK